MMFNVKVTIIPRDGSENITGSMMFDCETQESAENLIRGAYVDLSKGTYMVLKNFGQYGEKSTLFVNQGILDSSLIKFKIVGE